MRGVKRRKKNGWKGWGMNRCHGLTDETTTTTTTTITSIHHIRPCRVVDPHLTRFFVLSTYEIARVNSRLSPFFSLSYPAYKYCLSNAENGWELDREDDSKKWHDVTSNKLVVRRSFEDRSCDWIISKGGIGNLNVERENWIRFEFEMEKKGKERIALIEFLLEKFLIAPWFKYKSLWAGNSRLFQKENLYEYTTPILVPSFSFLPSPNSRTDPLNFLNLNFLHESCHPEKRSHNPHVSSPPCFSFLETKRFVDTPTRSWNEKF